MDRLKQAILLRKKVRLALMRSEDTKQQGLRYSILFDFDKSKTKEVYEKFLAEVVML